MQNINKELEQQIIGLIKNNRAIEAVALVQNELKLGMKQSKDIVDHYREMK